MIFGMSVRDIRRQVGQLAIVGFNGHEVPDDVRQIAKAFDLGGVVFFARNVADPEQVREMSRESQFLARDLPLWVSVDQEGGRVARLKRPFTEWPPMITLGRARDETLARRFAKALAAELAAVGISLDYTPVLDIFTNPKNSVIGDRALAERAEDVARLGSVIIRTLQAEGMAACGKHFPGHGDTTSDSHFELPLVEHGPDRLEAIELVPFKAAIEANVAAIMTAHILIPALDGERPATLSPAIVDGLLKKTLGFGGVVFTDDMHMKAITARYGLSDATVMAIAAGCDGVLMCAPEPAEQTAALEAVIYAVEQGRLPQRRVDDALARQKRAKERFLSLPGHRTQPATLRSVLGTRRASGDRGRDGEIRVAMQKPRALAPGDRIAVVAPASPFARDEFEAGLQELRRLGYEPVYEDSVFARRAYVAGDATVRAAAFQKAWADGSVRALIAVRGGYGSAQLLPLFNSAEMRRTPKAFIGYSDNTSILAWLTTRCGVVSFHGPMLEGRLARGEAAYDRSSFERVLTRAEPAGLLTHPQLETLRPGEAVGTLVGGTLDPTPGIAGDAIRLRSPSRTCALHRRGRRASVSPGPYADAAAIRRSAQPRRRRGVRRAAAL